MFDLSDLFKLLFLIALFSPILPWDDRKPISRNYSLYEPIRPLTAFVDRELIDFESIRTRYEREIPDEGLRDCLLKRNIMDKISTPSFGYESVFLRTAEACQAFPNAYLSLTDIEPLKPLDISNENISFTDLFFDSTD